MSEQDLLFKQVIHDFSRRICLFFETDVIYEHSSGLVSLTFNVSETHE
jgi:hypothetical protein